MSSLVKNPDNSDIYDYLSWFGQMVGQAVTVAVEVVEKVSTTAKKLLGDTQIPPGTINDNLLYSSPRERILANARRLDEKTRLWEEARKKMSMPTIIETDEKD